MKSPLPKLIGISGTVASGKDTLANYLADQYTYKAISSGDMVRLISMKRHGSIERPELQETAKYYRDKYGADYFIKAIIKDYQASNKDNNYKGLIITGLRSVGEASAVKSYGGVVLFLDSPIKLRYERMQARARDQEVGLSLKEFEASGQKEWHSGDDPSDFSLKNIKNMADAVIDNDYNLAELESEAISKLSQFA